MLSNEKIARLEKTYPKGTRVRCLKMEDPCNPVPKGTIGTVRIVDDIGTIHVDWDNGSTLGLIPNEDEWEIVN